jgi:hypothetical protein
MIIYTHKEEDRICFLARAEGESQDGAIVGDLCHTIGPGQSAFGKSYAEWATLPEGAHQIEGARTGPPAARAPERFEGAA